MAAGSNALEYPMQLVHYLRKSIAYNTQGIGTDATVKVGTLPAGALVLFTLVKVTTAFNAATTNIIDVGTSGNDDALVDGGATGNGDADVNATAAGATFVWRGADETFTADTPIYVTYTQSGTAASAGAAQIIVAFVVGTEN